MPSPHFLFLLFVFTLKLFFCFLDEFFVYLSLNESPITSQYVQINRSCWFHFLEAVCSGVVWLVPVRTGAISIWCWLLFWAYTSPTTVGTLLFSLFPELQIHLFSGLNNLFWCNTFTCEWPGQVAWKVNLSL